MVTKKKSLGLGLHLCTHLRIHCLLSSPFTLPAMLWSPNHLYASSINVTHATRTLLLDSSLYFTCCSLHRIDAFTTGICTVNISNPTDFLKSVYSWKSHRLYPAQDKWRRNCQRLNPGWTFKVPVPSCQAHYFSPFGERRHGLRRVFCIHMKSVILGESVVQIAVPTPVSWNILRK